jgi:solute carrier family 13 (sodium-dependent dicarboxylate transporter), member 2/3/5
MQTARGRLASGLLGAAVAAALGIGTRTLGLPPAACWTAAVTGLCAVWWVLEPIPIPATSLIPFAAFPLTGVLDDSRVATAYGHTLILLLLGGFVLSTAMEKSTVHRRIALGMVRLVGGRSRKRLVLGFMLACGVVSMWISNTATVLMMLPVVLAILEADRDDAFAGALLLGVAYASSIGGLGTPIGTPPNVIFMGAYREATGIEIGFLDWMKIGVPVTLALLPIAWWVVTRRIESGARIALPESGPWRPAEWRVLAVFGATALAWITRTEPFGGWSGLLGASGVGDATVALAAVVVLFLIPDGDGGRLLDWQTANRIPWGLLILFGGGIAIARAFEESGLSRALGSALGGIAALPVPVMLLILALAVTFLTEVTSNTATATLLMPILAATAAGAGLEPALLMIPAALSASCAFMLPVATAPNAIAFGTERVPARLMAARGLWINLLGALAIALLCALLVPR